MRASGDCERWIGFLAEGIRHSDHPAIAPRITDIAYTLAQAFSASLDAAAEPAIYLAFSLLQLGIAIWVNSVWLLTTLVGAVALMHCVVIPREERYLERKFGAQYTDYKASVRRWL